MGRSGEACLIDIDDPGIHKISAKPDRFLMGRNNEITDLGLKQIST